MAVEYLASNEFTANGSQTDWTVSFKGNRPDAVSGTTPYLNSTDVKAQEITPATPTHAEIVVDKTCVAIGPNTFRVTPAPANGHIVRIYRATQDEYNLVDYKSRQTVTEADLDLSNRQNIFIVQETSDLANRASQDAVDATTLAYAATTTANTAVATANTANANAIAAGNTASNAVSTANAAQTTASAAVATANTASTKADTAITTANTAKATADGLNSQIGTANSNASAALTAATNANATAGSANTIASNAAATAATALSTANTAKTTADTAKATADSATTAAASATSTANSAATTANSANTTAGTALSTANAASTSAGNAVTTANAAAATANGLSASITTANTNASNAVTAANAATTTANGIASTANTALTNANAAVSTANAANATANAVDTKATNALSTANAANTTAGTANTTANNASSAAATALSTAQAAQAAIDNANTSFVAEGSNLYFTAARVLATVLTGLSVATNAVVTASDTVLSAIGKLQAQVTARYTKTEIDAKIGTAGIGWNLIDNASFFISQRSSLSLSSAAAGVYFLDRWKSNVASTSCTRVRAASPTGEYSLNVTAGSIVQVVDATTFVVGGTYVFSHAGTATVTIKRNGTTIATRAGAGQVSFSLDVVGLTSLTVEVGTGTLVRPKLEIGSVATPFVPLPAQLDLVQCQRYMVRLYGLGFNGYQTHFGTYFSDRLVFPTTMVAVPTLVPQAPAWTTSNITTVTWDAATTSGMRQLVYGGGAVNVDMAFDFGVGDFVQASCEP